MDMPVFSYTQAALTGLKIIRSANYLQQIKRFHIFPVKRKTDLWAPV
jgi:hypothetical protein